MEPIPLCKGQLILAETHDLAVYQGACGADCAAALAPSAGACMPVAEAVRESVPVGCVVEGIPGPEGVSGGQPHPTEALIGQYKDLLRQGIPEQADFLYLRGTDSFASLRCAVLAATDLTGRSIMAEVPVGADGVLPFGTDIVAAVAVLQRIGVGTVIVSGEAAQDVADALARCAPYARVSLGARVDPSWLAGDVRFTNAELYVPRRAEDIGALRAALAAYTGAVQVPRDHDGLLIAPDGTNTHFIDPMIDISDGIECDSHLGELLLAAEDGSGAYKILLQEEEDLICFEEHVFMLARPVCLCTEQPELLEKALRIYPGRALYDGTWELDARLTRYFSEKYGMICL